MEVLAIQYVSIVMSEAARHGGPPEDRGEAVASGQVVASGQEVASGQAAGSATQNGGLRTRKRPAAAAKTALASGQGSASGQAVASGPAAASGQVVASGQEVVASGQEVLFLRCVTLLHWTGLTAKHVPRLSSAADVLALFNAVTLLGGLHGADLKEDIRVAHAPWPGHGDNLV